MAFQPKKVRQKRPAKRSGVSNDAVRLRQLYYGDNLKILRRYMPAESVDLVYLDPPFQSGRDHNILFEDKHGKQSSAQIKAFEDTWHWGQEAAENYEDAVEQGGQVALALRAFRSFLGESDMMAYLAMMAPRLIELRRVLKPTGSIYLHCDPTASHYLRSLMDTVFGTENFRNEIIWKRTNSRSTLGRWPRVHDVLLFYTKTERFYFRSLKTKADRYKLPHTLITGSDGKKYQTYELTGAGTSYGESGKPWRGFSPKAMGRHWGNSHAQMDEWDKHGLIHWPKRGSAGGFPRRIAEKPFDATAREVSVSDVWIDIDRLNQTAKERLGYPTQKPEALLERIISASSEKGHVVLDPFCGCGTTVASAQKLGRSWIGIDITYIATNLIKHRLREGFDDADFDVIGEPVSVQDAAQLAKEDPYQFQWWILGLVGARGTDQKKGADRGIDGRLYFHEGHRRDRTKQVIISVKAGKPGVSHVRDLRGVVEREEAEIGALLLMQPPTRAMLTEASAAGFYESPWGKHPRIQILTADQLLRGHQIDYPAPRYSNVTHRRVLKVRPADREQLGFDLSG